MSNSTPNNMNDLSAYLNGYPVKELLKLMLVLFLATHAGIYTGTYTNIANYLKNNIGVNILLFAIFFYINSDYNTNVAVIGTFTYCVVYYYANEQMKNVK
jgi:hypothetical protein